MKKFAALSLCLILLLSNLIFSASAASFRDEATASAQKLLNAELTLNGVGSAQDFSRFCASVPESAYGQFLFPLALNGCTGGQNVDALCNIIVNGAGTAASTRQKYALMLLACGYENEYCDTVIDETVGKQGIMSLVFALHLLNNGRKSETYTAMQLAGHIASLALENGGWALMGSSADTDVTAMVIQALAPFYKTDNAVKVSIDTALDVLTERQGESGAFTGFGGENAETTAQVIIALNSLGSDFITDSRFIKNGNTAFDGLKRFELADGTFSHAVGGEYDVGATAQAYCALVSFECGSIYIFDNAELQYTDLALNPAEPTAENAKTPLKYILAAAVVIIALVITVILFAVKKRNIKNFIFLWLAAAAAVACIFVFNVQSADEFYNSPATQKGDITGTVSLEIRCDTVAAENGGGVILPKTEFQICKGDSVYTVLCEASQKYGIKLITGGYGKSVYVSGIENLCEFDYGDLSGWLYTVNGEGSSQGCGSCELKDGDSVEFLYSLNLGEDVGVNTP